MKKLLILAITLLPFNALATQWNIDHAQSHVAFAGTHAGNAFKGTFAKWNADIDFDPAAPEKGTVKVTIDLTSAATGDATYDATLPQDEWLNSENETQATWQSNAIRKIKDNQYEAEGNLMLRGKSVPVMIAFTLDIAPNGIATMHGTTTLKRLDFDIGKSSDAAGDWVSLDIPLDVLVVASPAP